MMLKLLDKVFILSKYIIFGVLVQCVLYSIVPAYDGEAQKISLENIRISVAIENKSIREVFRQIEELTDFEFAYHKSVINSNQKLRIKQNNDDHSLADLLRTISRETNLGFKRVGQLIYVKKKEKRSKVEVLEHLEEKIISGKVINENGEGLPGASILVKGTTQGTITDADGNYTLSVPGNATTLVFSFIGYLQEEVEIGERTVIDVRMVLDLATLQEVVVTGYTSQSRRSITGSVETVESTELAKNPAISVEQQLQGKVSGVDIVTSGAPGGGTQVRIRGLGTFNSRSPLYIIDGAPSGSGLNDINPNDIESVSVLKDASAASIYGARAANGVIVITTKRGKKGQPAKVSYNSFYGIDVDPGRLDVLNAEQWGIMEFQGQVAAVRGTPAEDAFVPSHPSYGSGTPVIPEFINGDPSLPYDPATNRIMRSGDNNWYNVLTQTAFVQSHDLSIIGGGENSRYGLSFGYLDREGTRIYTSYQRYSTRVNAEFTFLDDRVRVGENLTVAYSERNGRQGISPNERFTYHPLIPRRDEGGNFGGTLNGILGLGTNFNNPEAEQIRLKDNVGRRLRLFGNAYIEGDILPNLIFKSSVGIDHSQNNSTSFEPERPEGGLPGGFLREASDFFSSITWTNTLDYTLDLDDHTISVLAGTEEIKLLGRNINYTGTDFFTENLDFVTISTAGSTQNVLGGNGERKLSSLFGKIDYSFRNKYLINATIRRDGSSALGPNDRFDVFPALGAGWVFSEESFLQGNSLINMLKVRVGWGAVGNQNSLPDFGFVSVFSQDPTAMSTGYDISASNGDRQENGIALLSRGNPNLVWESSETLNIGLDFSLLEDKISGSVEWYDKRTKDLLLRPPVPLTSGIAAPPFVNAGEIQNTGIDVLLSYEGKVGPVDIGVTGIITRYRNEVLDIDGNPESFFQSGNNRTEVGRPIGLFYGLIVDGVIQEGPDAGNFDFRDLNDDSGISLVDDQTFIGNPHPDFTYSLNVTANYHNFDFTAFFRGSQGNDLWQSTKASTDFQFRAGFNRSTRVLNAWRPDNPTNELAEFNLNTAERNLRGSTYYVEDGSYLRLQTLQIGYTIPELKGIERLRIYLQGQNVFTITNYSGIDPEIFEGGGLVLGVDGGTGFIVPRTFLLGLNVTF